MHTEMVTIRYAGHYVTVSAPVNMNMHVSLSLFETYKWTAYKIMSLFSFYLILIILREDLKMWVWVWHLSDLGLIHHTVMKKKFFWN